MKKLRSLVRILMVVLVALVLVLLIGRNVILKTSLPPALRKITGFDAAFSDIDVGLFSSHVLIKDLKVSNPSDFGDKRMLDAPEIYVKYKPFTMCSSRREFPSIRLNIQQVVVVKNNKGESNVARIMEYKPKGGGNTENHFGTLDLTLGKVTYLDYSRMRDNKPFTKEMTLNFHGTYHDLLDADLTKVVMFETLKLLPVKLKDITPESIQKNLTGVAGIGMSVATNLQQKATGFFEGLGNVFHSKSNAPPNGK